MAKAKTQIDGLSHKFIRNNNEFRVIQNYKTIDAVSGYRAISLLSDGEVKAADHYSSNVLGFSAGAASISAGGTLSAVVGGPAYAYPQSRIDCGLPIKVTEAGRITHGIIKTHTGRVIIAATDGQDDEVTSESNNERITVVSDSASDTTQKVTVYAKEKTTGTAIMLTGTLNGTTEVNLYELDGTRAYCDEVYGAELDAVGVGTILVENFTTNTDLVSMAASVTQGGVTDMTTPNNAMCRPVKITFNQQSAAQELFLVGTDYNGDAQYEIITHDAAGQLVYQSSNSYRTLDKVADGKIKAAATATTYAIQSLATNEFVTDWVNMEDNLTYTGATQSQQKVEVLSDDASDDGKITVFGADSTTARYDEITLNGTTPVASTNNYTVVYGAYISDMGTQCEGSITVQKADDTDLFVFDAATQNAGGLFGPEGHETPSTMAAHSLFDIPGCNARPTIQLSASGATDAFMIVGEDVDGTAQYEICAFVAGSFESVNTWSRITAIAGVTCDNTEYLKIMFEDEDNPAVFCGISAGVATAQSTSTGVPIWAQSAYGVEYGKGADTVILSRIMGDRSYTDVDSKATSARTAFFPDASGVVMLTGASAPGKIITVGATGFDYTTLALAEAAATADDWIWIMEDLAPNAETDISKKLRITGMGGGNAAEFPNNKTIISSNDAGNTIDIAAAGCILENLTITNSKDTSATDCALKFTNVGGEVRNCYLIGTNRLSLSVTSDGAADDVYVFDTHMDSDVLTAAGAASTLRIERSVIAGKITTDDPAVLELVDVDITETLNLVGGTATLKGTTVTGATNLITTASTFTAYDCVFTGLFTTNITANTVSIYRSHFANKLYLDDCGTVIIENCRIAGDASNSVQADAIATSATFYNCTLTDQLDHNAGTISFYNSDIEQLDLDGSPTLNLYGCHVRGTLVEAGGGTVVADDTYFDTDVTNAAGTFTFNGCFIQGTATGTIGGNQRLDNAAIFPSNVRTVGVGGNYTSIETAVDAASGGETYVLLDASYTVTSTLAADVAITLVGLSDDTVITAATDIVTMTVTAAGCEFRNIHFTNTDNDGAADGTVTITNVGAKFINCTFDKTTGGNDQSIVITADGADTVEFHNCNITDGPAVFGGHASSNLRFIGGVISDTISIDTGSFFFENVTLDGALTVGGTAKPAVSYFKDCHFGAAVTVTDDTSFNVDGGSLGSTFTNTASDETIIKNIKITGNVSVVASTYIEFSNVIFGGTFAQTGAVTEGYIRDSDFASTFAMSTAAATFELHNVRITGTSTINHASANLKAHSSHFIGNVTFTDADNVDIYDSIFDGTTDIDAGTLYHLRDNEFTGAVVQDGGTSVVYVYDSTFTAVFTNNNAGADTYAFGCHFVEGITDAAGTYGIVQLNHCKLDATATAVLATLVGTSFTANHCAITNLINWDGGDATFNNCQLEEIDQDGGTLNTNKCYISGAFASDGTALNDQMSVFVGVLAQGAGTVTLADSYLVGTATGTLGGDYIQYNASYLKLGEGGNNKQARKFLCGTQALTDETICKVAGGSVLDNDSATGAGAGAWGVGNWTGGAATRGFIRFAAAADVLTLSIPLPELQVDTGTAADFRVGFRLDPTNADDRMNYAFYSQDGSHLVDEVDNTISGATEATKWVNLGALSWSKGDQLVISIGGFETSAAGAVNVDLYWIEYEFTVGIENDS